MAFTPIYNFARDRAIELHVPEEGSQSQRAGCPVRVLIKGNYVSLNPEGVRDLIRQLSESLSQNGEPIRVHEYTADDGRRSAFA